GTSATCRNHRNRTDWSRGGEAMYNGFDLSKKVAVLTGSTAGMGFAIARGLAQCGAKVVVSSNTQEDTEEVVHKLSAEGFEVKGVRCDITRRTDVANFGDQVRDA